MNLTMTRLLWWILFVCLVSSKSSVQTALQEEASEWSLWTPCLADQGHSMSYRFKTCGHQENPEQHHTDHHAHQNCSGTVLEVTSRVCVPECETVIIQRLLDDDGHLQSIDQEDENEARCLQMAAEQSKLHLTSSDRNTYEEFITGTLSRLIPVYTKHRWSIQEREVINKIRMLLAPQQQDTPVNPEDFSKDIKNHLKRYPNPNQQNLQRLVNSQLGGLRINNLHRTSEPGRKESEETAPSSTKEEIPKEGPKPNRLQEQLGLQRNRPESRNHLPGDIEAPNLRGRYSPLERPREKRDVETLVIAPVVDIEVNGSMFYRVGQLILHKGKQIKEVLQRGIDTDFASHFERIGQAIRRLLSGRWNNFVEKILPDRTAETNTTTPINDGHQPLHSFFDRLRGLLDIRNGLSGESGKPEVSVIRNNHTNNSSLSNQAADPLDVQTTSKTAPQRDHNSLPISFQPRDIVSNTIGNQKQSKSQNGSIVAPEKDGFSPDPPEPPFNNSDVPELPRRVKRENIGMMDFLNMLGNVNTSKFSYLNIPVLDGIGKAIETMTSSRWTSSIEDEIFGSLHQLIELQNMDILKKFLKKLQGGISLDLLPYAEQLRDLASSIDNLQHPNVFRTAIESLDMLYTEQFLRDLTGLHSPIDVSRYRQLLRNLIKPLRHQYKTHDLQTFADRLGSYQKIIAQISDNELASFMKVVLQNDQNQNLHLSRYLLLLRGLITKRKSISGLQNLDVWMGQLQFLNSSLGQSNKTNSNLNETNTNQNETLHSVKRRQVPSQPSKKGNFAFLNHFSDLSTGGKQKTYHAISKFASATLFDMMQALRRTDELQNLRGLKRFHRLTSGLESYQNMSYIGELLMSINKLSPQELKESLYGSKDSKRVVAFLQRYLSGNFYEKYRNEASKHRRLLSLLDEIPRMTPKISSSRNNSRLLELATHMSENWSGHPRNEDSLYYLLMKMNLVQPLAEELADIIGSLQRNPDEELANGINPDLEMLNKLSSNLQSNISTVRVLANFFPDLGALLSGTSYQESTNPHIARSFMDSLLHILQSNVILDRGITNLQFLTKLIQDSEGHQHKGRLPILAQFLRYLQHLQMRPYLGDFDLSPANISYVDFLQLLGDGAFSEDEVFSMQHLANLTNHDNGNVSDEFLHLVKLLDLLQSSQKKTANEPELPSYSLLNMLVNSRDRYNTIHDMDELKGMIPFSELLNGPLNDMFVDEIRGLIDSNSTRHSLKIIKVINFLRNAIHRGYHTSSGDTGMLQALSTLASMWQANPTASDVISYENLLKDLGNIESDQLYRGKDDIETLVHFLISALGKDDWNPGEFDRLSHFADMLETVSTAINISEVQRMMMDIWVKPHQHPDQRYLEFLSDVQSNVHVFSDEALVKLNELVKAHADSFRKHDPYALSDLLSIIGGSNDGRFISPMHLLVSRQFLDSYEPNDILMMQNVINIIRRLIPTLTGEDVAEITKLYTSQIDQQGPITEYLRLMRYLALRDAVAANRSLDVLTELKLLTKGLPLFGDRGLRYENMTYDIQDLLRIFDTRNTDHGEILNFIDTLAKEPYRPSWPWSSPVLHKLKHLALHGHLPKNLGDDMLRSFAGIFGQSRTGPHDQLMSLLDNLKEQFQDSYEPNDILMMQNVVNIIRRLIPTLTDEDVAEITKLYTSQIDHQGPITEYLRLMRYLALRDAVAANRSIDVLTKLKLLTKGLPLFGDRGLRYENMTYDIQDLLRIFDTKNTYQGEVLNFIDTLVNEPYRPSWPLSNPVFHKLKLLALHDQPPKNLGDDILSSLAGIFGQSHTGPHDQLMSLLDDVKETADYQPSSIDVVAELDRHETIKQWMKDSTSALRSYLESVNDVLGSATQSNAASFLDFLDYTDMDMDADGFNRPILDLTNLSRIVPRPVGNARATTSIYEEVLKQFGPEVPHTSLLAFVDALQEMFNQPDIDVSKDPTTLNKMGSYLENIPLPMTTALDDIHGILIKTEAAKSYLDYMEEMLTSLTGMGTGVLPKLESLQDLENNGLVDLLQRSSSPLVDKAILEYLDKFLGQKSSAETFAAGLEATLQNEGTSNDVNFYQTSALLNNYQKDIIKTVAFQQYFGDLGDIVDVIGQYSTLKESMQKPGLDLLDLFGDVQEFPHETFTGELFQDMRTFQENIPAYGNNLENTIQLLTSIFDLTSPEFINENGILLKAFTEIAIHSENITKDESKLLYQRIAEHFEDPSEHNFMELLGNITLMLLANPEIETDEHLLNMIEGIDWITYKNQELKKVRNIVDELRGIQGLWRQNAGKILQIFTPLLVPSSNNITEQDKSDLFELFEGIAHNDDEASRNDTITLYELIHNKFFEVPYNFSRETIEELLSISNTASRDKISDKLFLKLVDRFAAVKNDTHQMKLVQRLFHDMVSSIPIRYNKTLSRIMEDLLFHENKSINDDIPLLHEYERILPVVNIIEEIVSFNKSQIGSTQDIVEMYDAMRHQVPNDISFQELAGYFADLQDIVDQRSKPNDLIQLLEKIAPASEDISRNETVTLFEEIHGKFHEVPTNFSREMMQHILSILNHTHEEKLSNKMLLQLVDRFIGVKNDSQQRKMVHQLFEDMVSSVSWSYNETMTRLIKDILHLHRKRKLFPVLHFILTILATNETEIRNEQENMKIYDAMNRHLAVPISFKDFTRYLDSIQDFVDSGNKNDLLDVIETIYPVSENASRNKTLALFKLITRTFNEPMFSRGPIKDLISFLRNASRKQFRQKILNSKSDDMLFLRLVDKLKIVKNVSRERLLLRRTFNDMISRVSMRYNRTISSILEDILLLHQHEGMPPVLDFLQKLGASNQSRIGNKEANLKMFDDMNRQAPNRFQLPDFTRFLKDLQNFGEPRSPEFNDSMLVSFLQNASNFRFFKPSKSEWVDYFRLITNTSASATKDVLRTFDTLIKQSRQGTALLTFDQGTELINILKNISDGQWIHRDESSWRRIYDSFENASSVSQGKHLNEFIKHLFGEFRNETKVDLSDGIFLDMIEGLQNKSLLTRDRVLQWMEAFRAIRKISLKELRNTLGSLLEIMSSLEAVLERPQPYPSSNEEILGFFQNITELSMSLQKSDSLNNFNEMIHRMKQTEDELYPGAIKGNRRLLLQLDSLFNPEEFERKKREHVLLEFLLKIPRLLNASELDEGDMMALQQINDFDYFDYSIYDERPPEDNRGKGAFADGILGVMQKLVRVNLNVWNNSFPQFLGQSPSTSQQGTSDLHRMYYSLAEGIRMMSKAFHGIVSLLQNQALTVEPEPITTSPETKDLENFLNHISNMSQLETEPDLTLTIQRFSQLTTIVKNSNGSELEDVVGVLSSLFGPRRGKTDEWRLKNTDSINKWSEWTAWSTCSVTCGHGEQVMRRTCSISIEGLLIASDQCVGKAEVMSECQVECQEGSWAGWSFWSRCDNRCGVGNQTRSRLCDWNHTETNAIHPVNHFCNGYSEEKKICREYDFDQCSLHDIFVPGTWSEWSAWTKCPDVCKGYRDRQRSCHPLNETIPRIIRMKRDEGLLCEGDAKENVSCEYSTVCWKKMHPVIIASWTAWSPWSQCSNRCGVGNKTRSRRCQLTNHGVTMATHHGNHSCYGDSQEKRTCSEYDFDECTLHDIFVPGTWTEWSQWSKCSENCRGNRNRHRLCHPLTEQTSIIARMKRETGLLCEGNSTQNSSCISSDCEKSFSTSVVTASWTAWSPWSQCSNRCGVGNKTRSRRCQLTNQYIPMATHHGNHSCYGDFQEKRTCSEYDFDECTLHDLFVPGTWTEWGQWSNCSENCSGHRNRNRHRLCHPLKEQTSMIPRMKRDKGLLCKGNPTQNSSCISSDCKGSFNTSAVTAIVHHHHQFEWQITSEPVIIALAMIGFVLFFILIIWYFATTSRRRGNKPYRTNRGNSAQSVFQTKRSSSEGSRWSSSTRSFLSWRSTGTESALFSDQQSEESANLLDNEEVPPDPSRFCPYRGRSPSSKDDISAEWLYPWETEGDDWAGLDFEADDVSNMNFDVYMEVDESVEEPHASVVSPERKPLAVGNRTEDDQETKIVELEKSAEVWFD